MLPPVRTEPWPLINLWFQVHHSPFWVNWAFACKAETLGSLYSHALLIPTKSPKSKNKVIHKQKFKGPLSSTCQVSSERSVGLGIRGKSEVIPHWGKHFITGFFCFHIVKPLMPILALLSMLCVYENPDSLLTIHLNVEIVVNFPNHLNYHRNQFGLKENVI